MKSKYIKFFLIAFLLISGSFFITNHAFATLQASGYLDTNSSGTNNCGTLSGWAWDPDLPNNATSVHIYRNGVFEAAVVAGDHRIDLPGNKRHGFTYFIPGSWKTGTDQTINVYAIDLSTPSDGNPNLVFSPGVINCSISVPTVTTSTVTEVTQNTATVYGNVTSIGGDPVSVSGCAWSTLDNPSYTLGGENQTTDGWALGGPWSCSITGLSANTTYYVRTYAKNTAGVGYGVTRTFTTSSVNTPVISGPSEPLPTPLFTVTFDKNGGDTEASPRTKTAPVGGNVGTLPGAPTWAGRNFLNWKENANGTGSAFNANTVVIADKTVYANWGGRSAPVVIPPGSTTPFFNLFQVRKPGNDATIVDLTALRTPSLGSGESRAVESSPFTFGSGAGVTFNTPGTYEVRACADKSSSSGGGVIAELDENDNCGPWTTVTVSTSGGNQNGGWSAWSPAEATVACGTTVNQTRTCTNPAPSGTGLQCLKEDGTTRGLTETRSYTAAACPNVPNPSASISANSCEIQAGSSKCFALVSWNTSNLTPGATEVTRNNPRNTHVSSILSGVNVSNEVNYNASTFFVYHNINGVPTRLAEASVNAYCSTGAIWDGSKCRGTGGLSGTLTPNKMICEIKVGESACVSNPIKFTWATTIGGGAPTDDSVSAVTSNRSPNYIVGDKNSFPPNGYSGIKDFAVKYGTETFYLYNSSATRHLAEVTVAGRCAVNTAWDPIAGKCVNTIPSLCGNGLINTGEQCDDGSAKNGNCPSLCSIICTDRPTSACFAPGDVRINVNPSGIVAGNTSTLTWSWDGVEDAICKANFDQATGRITLPESSVTTPVAQNGSVTVEPNTTTTYRIDCAGEKAQTVLTVQKKPDYKED